jgi:hypothetical protein
LQRKISKLAARQREIEIQRIEIFSPEEKQVITSIAAGDNKLLPQAIAIHRKVMLIYGIRPLDPFYRFMSEVDNPCPDSGLRARYRKDLLALASKAEFRS